MTLTPPTSELVTLDNCAREPIHIPGSIQPHGALLAFDRIGRLVAMSENANRMLGLTLPLGRTLRVSDIGEDADVYSAIQHGIASLGESDTIPDSREVVLNDTTFDLVVHAHESLCVCEFEQRDDSSDQLSKFPPLAYRSMEKLKRQRSIDKLLETAVNEVRAMTGFDRVMAYRFRHDDSGDIVAESCSGQVDPYLGRRYPASDIPAQARRLYVLNTLRLIADVSYTPVALVAHEHNLRPIDLSHSTLRSVSPIHIEYLTNMGVKASMSVSIVIGGKLWGMLACHHMAPLRVPYSIRMATDVIAQLIASSVQSIDARDREATMARAAVLRTEIASQIAQGHETVDVLAREATALRESLECDALIVSFDGQIHRHGDVDEKWATELIAWLETSSQSLVHVHDCNALPESPVSHRYCGVLGLRFDAPRGGWLIALRVEQIETIRWGGKPEKNVTIGPLGPRLTPRGSFDEWRETVRGTAVPWSDIVLERATLLLESVSRLHAERVLELDRLRSQMWAVMGHDLRDPLHTLSMASVALDRQPASDRISSVIRSSTNRMQRLLRDLQDLTRIHNGLGLSIDPVDTDLVALITQLLEENRAAYPGLAVTATLPATLVARVDPTRFLQLATNLLSNARIHGNGTLAVSLADEGDAAVLTVSNPSPPLDAELVRGLFDPFKRSSLANSRNAGSMGLGLYIVDQVARAHGGSVRYRSEAENVSFAIRLAKVPG